MKKTELKQKKRAYVILIETLVNYGYDISEMLNPIYKNICLKKCVDNINSLISEHGDDIFYNYDLTFKE